MGPLAPVYPPKLFPYCVVWTPIPLISWLLPFVGHMGIGMSDGTLLDFAGPYFVSTDNFAFGNPTRYVQLDPKRAARLPFADLVGTADQSVSQAWDTALGASVAVYQRRMYNFLGDNCHCFVAHFLNSIHYDARHTWSMVHLAVLILFQGRMVGVAGAAKTFLPFLVLFSLGAYFGGLWFLFGWFAFLLLLSTWFGVVTLLQHRHSASCECQH